MLSNDISATSASSINCCQRNSLIRSELIKLLSLVPARLVSVARTSLLAAVIL